MSKYGSKIDVFGDITERIKKRHQDKLINENEVKLEVIKTIKELQSQLTLTSFLDALSMMNPDNPLKKQVETFESELSALRTKIDAFVVDNQFDIESEIPEEEVEEPEIPEEEEVPEEKEEEPEKIKASGEDKKVDQEDNNGESDKEKEEIKKKPKK